MGLVPLMIEGSLFPRLLFAGTGRTPYLDLLAREGWEEQVIEAGVDALKAIGRWWVADLQELRPEALTWRLFSSWGGPKAFAWKDYYLTIDAESWEELLKPLSKNLRKTARRTLQRAEKDGVYCKLAEPERVDEAARALVRLHRQLWQGREIEPHHLTRRFESHTITAARRMTFGGLGAISESWRGGEVVISNFMVWKPGFFGCHLTGASQEALKDYQWSSLMIWDALNAARARNSPYLSLGRGLAPYKLRWQPSKVTNHRIVLGRSKIVWLPYAGFIMLTSKVRRYRLESFETPNWMKNLASKYRLLRSRIRLIRTSGR